MVGSIVAEQDVPAVLVPHVLVVIPTWNRPADVGRCLKSLASVAYPSWELLIVDQSDDDATQRLAETYRSCLPKLTHQRVPERGLCRARNLGLERAGADIVAYIDDDCTVTSDWLAEVTAAFRRHPAATLVFGSVHAAPHDSREVVVPAMVFDRERTVAGSFTPAESGMGASMYLWPARSLHRQHFDVHLGAGTRWAAAEERDFVCRLIRAGDTVVLTPAIQVWHHGSRSLKEGAAGRLFRGYALAIGAADMKMIRCGDWASLWRALSRICRYVITVLSALATGRRPLGLGALVMYVRGLAESFMIPVDRVRCLYVTDRPAAKRR